MSETNYPGIDYSKGTVNFDKETGIHYGIISAHSLSPWALDDFEADYGEPACPKCGNGVSSYEDLEEDSEYENYREHSCADYFCSECMIILGSDDVFGDEPLGHSCEDDEIKLWLDSNNDVWIFKSPYFTHAQFCSPCAPGAGHLDNPCASGAKTYCLDGSWFEGDEAPYLVYRVSNGTLMEKE